VNPADTNLILLALAAIGALVWLITRWRVNAFVALLVAALLVGGGATLLGAGAAHTPYTMGGALDSIREGLGSTLGGIAAVLGLGAMLGKLLAESGGAAVLAERLTAWFGSRHAAWVVLALGAIVGLATWFTVGLLLLTPIVLTLARQTQRPVVVMILPLLTALSVTHGVMPPHPGPVVAVMALPSDMGLVLLWGTVVGLPTMIVAGPVLARFLQTRISLELPAERAQSPALLGGRKRPGLGLTLAIILLPVVLMLAATTLDLTLQPENVLGPAARVVAHPTVALLFTVLLAWWGLHRRCGYSALQLARFAEESVASIGLTLLVVGGGGAFARVLRDAGVAEALGRLGDSMHLPPLLYGWLLAAFVRVATGSATVAITTAAGLLAPMLAQQPEFNPHQVALCVVALGCGSLCLSHLNDGGFWIVKDCLGLTVSQTLRTWTVCETVIGVVGLLLAWACFQLL